MTTISVSDFDNPDASIVEAARNTIILDLKITLPIDAFGSPVLVRIDDIAATLYNVILDGNLGIGTTTGVFITGARSSGSVISNSKLLNLERGIHSINSGVTVTRNEFVNIRRDAVFIGLTSGKGAQLTPLLGAEDDISNTGFNRFRDVYDNFIKYDNVYPAITTAQFNDWGLFTEEEIRAKFDVPSKAGVDQIEFDRFIGEKLTQSSVIAIDLIDASTGHRILNSALPVVEIDGVAKERDRSGLWIFQTDLPGMYNVAAQATDYLPQTANAEALTGEVNAFRVSLTNSCINLCEGQSPVDADADGLSDCVEACIGTDSLIFDTDSDGLPDGWEFTNRLDPLVIDAAQDADADGLNNFAEFEVGTDPNDFDSDSDGIADGWEVMHGFNPLADDATGDPDADSRTNLQEFLDSTDPNSSDTDGDGLPDGYEADNGLDPRQNDTEVDADGDGLTNIEEFLLGTSAGAPDTDDDSLMDGYEIDNGLDPLTNDCEADLDSDGLSNCEEFMADTDPNDDTDPPVVVFVSVAGHDDTGDGTEANPWRTIGFAMTDVLRYSELHPVTISAGPGYYEEFVRFVANVTLQGAGPTSTAISAFDPINPDFNLVEAADNTVIRDLTIILPFGSFSVPVLVRIDSVDATLDNVVLDGSISIASPTGVYITGGSSSGSIIRNSTLINLDRGIHSVNSGVTVTRNLFDNIERDAVFIGFSSGPALTPVLGVEGDVVNTGFNRFREIGGDFIEYDNADPAHTFAQFNDWGVYTTEEIASRFTVPAKAGTDQIEFDRFIGNKLTLPTVVAVDLLDESTDDIIRDCASPVVEFDGDAQDRDVPSGLWIFQTSSPGAYNVAADAEGYAPGSTNADARAGEVSAYPMTLATNSEPND
ncbi:MAG: hypothetical protein AAB353_12915 [Candidatus Hydrogenedentota bacterium]